MRWQRTKLIYSDLDNIFNTGLYVAMCIEIVMTLIMPYPFLYGYTYMENANDFSADKVFMWNDFLLCFMIFARVHTLARSILSLSSYAEPRA